MTAPAGLLNRLKSMASGQSQPSTNGMTPQLSQTSSSALVDPAIAEEAAKDKKRKAFLGSKDAKELAAWVKSEYDRLKTARISVQREWYMNLSMYYGQQYYELMSATTPGVYNSTGLGVPKAPKHRVRTTVNLIRPMIRTEMSRLTSQKPSCTVTPINGTDEAMMAAVTAEACWEYIQHRRDFDTVMVRQSFWQTITGNGFVKTWWDDTKVDRTSKDVLGQAPVGDVCFAVVTPFNLFVPDLLCDDIEDQPYVFEAYTWPVQKVVDTFPDVFPDGKVTPDCIGSNEIFDTKYFLVGGKSADTKPDSVLFIEAWVKPGATKLLPNGGWVQMAGAAIVDVSLDGLPYSHNEYPYSHFKLIETGKFYADSTIVDVKYLQKEYNRTRSHIIESKNRMGRPQMVAAIGSLDPSKLTSEPGLIIMYNQGYAKPEAIPPVPLPQYVLQEQDRIKADIEDISGQHQASRGQSPGGGVNAATAISFLQERDDSLLYTAYQSIESGVEKIGRQSLVLTADYVDLPRIIRITGTDGAFDSLEFKGSDIANGLDLRTEGGSSLPTSKPARQAYLMDLYDRQAIDKDQLLDLMDMGGTQKLVDRLRVDMRAAQRENIRIKKITPDEMNQYAQTIQSHVQNGAPDGSDQNPNTGEFNYYMDPATWPPMVPVNDWDNHQVHVDTHNNYRKGQEFETLPQFVKQEFEKHIQRHLLALNPPQDPATMGMPGQAPGATPGAPGTPPAAPGVVPASIAGGTPNPNAASGDEAGRGVAGAHLGPRVSDMPAMPSNPATSITG